MQGVSFVRNLAWSAQGVILVICVQVVVVLGSCIVYARHEYCGALVLSMQGVDIVLSVQVVVVFRLLHFLCKA